MSGFNLLHLVTKSQPVALRACGLPSGSCRRKKSWPVSFPQEELRQRLTPIQYHVTQEKGTESAFRGEFTDQKEEGIYTCVVCGTPLFKSDKKFDSGSGWPAFYDLIKEDTITQTDDFSYGMHRVEATCSQCGAHLGHIFDDGPRPTGKRYCINSASMAFKSKEQTVPCPSQGAAAGAATTEASEVAAKEPTMGAAKEAVTTEASEVAVKGAAKGPTKGAAKEAATTEASEVAVKGAAKGPTKGAAKEAATTEASKGAAKGPTKGAAKGPTKGAAKEAATTEAAKGPTKGAAKGPTKGAAKGPTKGAAKEAATPEAAKGPTKLVAKGAPGSRSRAPMVPSKTEL